MILEKLELLTLKITHKLDSQSLIKNLKVTGRENSINLLNDYKIKITKNLNKSPTSNDIQKINTIKNYCKK